MLSGRLAGKQATVKLLPWQRQFLRDVYRRKGIRLGCISMGRKGGKSQTLIYLILATLLTNAPLAEDGGEILAVASDKLQADLYYREIQNMIQLMPSQATDLNFKLHEKQIHNTTTRTTFEVAPHGLSILGRRPSLIIADECGNWPETAKKGKVVWDALVTSQGSRDNAKLICASTQAATDEHWFSQEVIDYIRQVQRGVLVDPAVAGAIYAADNSDSIHDEKTWRKANPSLGTILSMQEFKTAYRQAKQLPSKLGSFKNYRLNMRCSPQQDANTELFTRESWQLCKEEYTIDDLKSEPCIVGIDLSKSTDLTAIAVYGTQSGRTLIYPYAPSAKALESSNKSLYTTWHNMGVLQLSAGATIDYREVVEKVAELVDLLDVKAVAYDPWNGHTLQRIISEDGYNFPNLTAVSQSYKYISPAIKHLIHAVLNKKIKHNSPVLTWCVFNARLRTDRNENYLIDKNRAVDAIDALSALLNALAYAVDKAFIHEYNFKYMFGRF